MKLRKSLLIELKEGGFIIKDSPKDICNDKKARELTKKAFGSRRFV